MKLFLKIFLFSFFVFLLSECSDDSDSKDVTYMYGSFYESIPTELEADSVYAFVFYEFLNGHNSLRDTSEVVGRAKLTNGKFVLKLQTLNNDMLCYNVSKMFQAGLDISDKDARVNGVLVRLMSNGYKLSEMFLRNNFDNNTVIRGYYICSDRVVSIKGVETRKDLPYSSVLTYNVLLKKGWNLILDKWVRSGYFTFFYECAADRCPDEAKWFTTND